MINFNDKKNRKVVSIVLIAVVILLIVAMALPMMMIR
ncbi:synaptobrevin-B [Hungatella hathewayi]